MKGMKARWFIFNDGRMWRCEMKGAPLLVDVWVEPEKKWLSFNRASKAITNGKVHPAPLGTRPRWIVYREDPRKSVSQAARAVIAARDSSGGCDRRPEIRERQVGFNLLPLTDNGASLYIENFRESRVLVEGDGADRSLLGGRHIRLLEGEPKAGWRVQQWKCLQCGEYQHKHRRRSSFGRIVTTVCRGCARSVKVAVPKMPRKEA